MTEIHIGQLKLRRIGLGELSGEEAEQARNHADHCAACRAQLKGFADDQRRFEEAISFERFAAGVERTLRQREVTQSRPWLYAAMGMAAAVLVTVAVQPLIGRVQEGRGTRLKGGADVLLRIAAAPGGPQRTVAVETPERLNPGERVRIGYQAGLRHYLAAVSVDAKGEVTALYPEVGASVPVEQGDQTHYLPGSLEFFGHGAERVVVVLSDDPLAVDELKRAAREAYDRGGDVLRMPRLRLPGEQFHRTLLKP